MSKQTQWIVLGTLMTLFAGAGAWLAHHQAQGGRGLESEIEHALVSKKDAAGRLYYTCAMHPQVKSDRPGACPICGMKLIKSRYPEPSAGTREVLYWYDPMRPEVRFDAPGKSPFMDMELVPEYADERGGPAVVIDPRVVQSLGVRSARVVRGAFARGVDTVGAIMADERRIEVVESRAIGWVERLHVRAVNEPVRRGQLLAEIYAPDLRAAQEELALALRMADGNHADALVEAARSRLLLLGVDAGQIARVENNGAAEPRVSYYARANGVVSVLGVREGQQVAPGMALFQVVDLSQVWLIAEIPEALASSVAVGDEARARLPSLPGRSYEGRVEYLYPELRSDTRTLAARIVLDNPALELKPGMYADVRLLGAPRAGVLQAPSEALIPTGERTIVILAQGAGRFRPVEVETGAERDGWTEIVSGLEEGAEVVVSGQFLIDSEASLRSALGRLSAPEAEVQPLQPEGTLRYHSNPSWGGTTGAPATGETQEGEKEDGDERRGEPQ